LWVGKGVRREEGDVEADVEGDVEADEEGVKTRSGRRGRKCRKEVQIKN
jgi:hypothetical protein